MSSEFDGVTIRVSLSTARPGEAEFRGMTVEEANETLRQHLRAHLERKYPGAAITVETEGDRPLATVEGIEDRRQAQVVQYDAEKTGLAIKWAFSTLGEGLPSTAR